MTHPSKIKGSAFEREVTANLARFGIYARKVPLSGAVKDDRHDHDIFLRIGALEFKCECKRRRRAFRTIDRMLGHNHFLFVRDDYARGLVVMSQDEFHRLLVWLWNATQQGKE